MSTHPTHEDFAGYLCQPMSAEYTHVGDHLHTCSQCNDTLKQMQTLLTSVKHIRQADISVIDATHITDEAMIGYVHRIPGPANIKDIEAHLNQCGDCMKAVLRYRAYLAEFNIDNTTDDTQQTAQARVVPLNTRNKNPNWLTVSVAIAATVLVAFFASMKLTPEQPPARIAQTPVPAVPVSPISAAARTDNRSGDNFITVAATPGNKINWYQGYIEATAIGTADMSRMKNKIQAESVAEKTARHLAYAQLAETIHGIQVTDSSTYQQLLLKVDNLSIQSEGFIRGAEVVDKQLTWEGDAPRVAITVRAPVFGQNSVRQLLQTTVPNNMLRETPVTGNQQTSPVVHTQVSGATPRYSSIIIDASDTGFTPAIFPQLISDKHRTVIKTETDPVLNYRYYADVQSAKSANIAGANPFIIRAKPSPDKGTLMISAEDAQRTHTSWQHADTTDHRSMLVVF